MKGQEMAVKANEKPAENVENVENETPETENVEQTESTEQTESEQTENVESDTDEKLVPEQKSPEQTYSEMDDANPVKAMVGLARTQLSASMAEIQKSTERIEEGTDSVEKEIEKLISDSEDEAVSGMRDEREKLEEALESLNADLRSAILTANPDLKPLSDEDKAKIEKDLATAKANHKALLSAMEKAIGISLPEKEAKFLLSDLAIKARGGSGSGVAKPRFKSASIKEEKADSASEITGDASASGDGHNISSGHIADAINKACDFTAVGNKIKPSQITTALQDAGYDGTEPLEFDFPVEGANKTFRIAVTPKPKA